MVTEACGALGRSYAIIGTDTGVYRFLPYISEALTEYARYLAECQVRIAFEQAQKEEGDLRQRTREGMETARMEGRQIGGRVDSKYHVKKASKAKEIIRRRSRRFGGTLDNAETWRLAGISETTFYRYCRQIEEEIGSTQPRYCERTSGAYGR